MHIYANTPPRKEVKTMTHEAFVMKFNTSLDGRHTFRVVNPQANITPAIAAASANTMLQADPFCPVEVGSLVSLYSASRVQQVTQVIFNDA
jgi:hypothetical protein